MQILGNTLLKSLTKLFVDSFLNYQKELRKNAIVNLDDSSILHKILKIFVTMCEFAVI